MSNFYLIARRKILFVCRGSTKDGMGHVMRSLALARAMLRDAEIKMVIIGDEYVGNLLGGKGIDYSIVGNDKEILPFYSDLNPDTVVFDTMIFDETCFKSISQETATVSLSPIFNLLHRVDFVFHRTQAVDRHWAVLPKSVQVFKGLSYTIISEHCQKIPDSIYRESLKHNRLAIGISMGGTDAANKTLEVLKKIREIKESLLIWVMLGEGYTHSYSELVDCTKESPHEIIMAKSNDSMWRILNTCALAILAGGTTAYESAYSGLPSINILETNRHIFLIKELVEKGACICAGDTFDDSVRTLNGIIRQLNKDRNRLFEMHLKAKSLIDDLGASRIKDQIYNYAGTVSEEIARARVGT